MPSPMPAPTPDNRRPAASEDAVPLTSGLEPIWRHDARVLVLGSMPSVASLASQTYYGHPQNAFWRILAAVHGIDARAPRDERAAAVRAARIAIWDVVAMARRQGSADAAIHDVRTNDIAALLLQMPECDRVLLNGHKAEELWRRHVAETVVAALEPSGRQLDVVLMPSTSPAHATMSLPEKTRRWREGLQ